MKSPNSRTNLLQNLARASIDGTLGFFVGSGFSKAVKSEPAALNWRELLEKVAGSFGIEFDKFAQEGRSYPRIATFLIEAIADKEEIDITEAEFRFKSKIGEHTSWLPGKADREKFSEVLKIVNPAWIITTNYDFVIESLFPDTGRPIGPKETFSISKNHLPIYHLHGHRRAPQDLVVSEKDYIGQLRPNQYRQTKLSLTLKESNVLVMGYELGDSNVQLALDWAKNVYQEIQKSYQELFVQVKYSPDSQENEPYKSSIGIDVVEVKDIYGFISELKTNIEELKSIFEKEEQSRENIKNALMGNDANFVSKFIDDDTFRNEWAKKIFDESKVAPSTAYNFISLCIDETKKRSLPKGAFTAYRERLNILLDLIILAEPEETHPLLFDFLISELNEVSYYVGREKGQSYPAHETWRKRNSKFSEGTVKAMKELCEHKGYMWLKKLLKPL